MEAHNDTRPNVGLFVTCLVDLMRPSVGFEVEVLAGQTCCSQSAYNAGDLSNEDTGDEIRFGDMPRTVNFITGPSRTGDVEQTIFMGAHGPRRMHIVLVENE